MPDDPSIRDRAKAAQTAADWPEAANCWQQLYRSDAGDREALLGLVCACQAQGLYRDAEALFDGAAADHAGHLDHAIAYAQNAQMRSDLEAALTRSRAIVERFPEHPYGYATLATLLAAAGRQEEGFDMLSRGARRFPDEPSLILPSIHVAVARQDWKRAATGLQTHGAIQNEEQTPPRPGRRPRDSSRPSPPATPRRCATRPRTPSATATSQPGCKPGRRCGR